MKTEAQKRIIGPRELAEIFGFSLAWVYKQTRKGAADPPPRCEVGRLRFDTWDPKFQAWLNRKLGCPERKSDFMTQQSFPSDSGLPSVDSWKRSA